MIIDSYLIADIPVLTPLITALLPSSGAIGNTITIQGLRFGAPQGSSTVTFGGVAASVVTWADTQIVAVVPPRSG